MDLKHQFIHAMFKFKRMGKVLPSHLDIHMGEFFVLKRIAENTTCSGNVNVSDIHCRTNFTMPAVSQILNGLEKKGYITREIDSKDRRKIAVAITLKGREILKETEEYANLMLDKIMSYFGEENMEKFIELFNLLTEAIEKVKSENITNTKKGDNQLG